MSSEIYVDIRKKLGDFTLDVRFSQDEKKLSSSGLDHESASGSRSAAQAGSTGNRATIGILGPSGCGKSVTLKCIAGVMRPDEGIIRVNGTTYFDSEKKIDLKPQQRRVGYMFQNYALFPNMNLRRNIECGIRGAQMQGRKHPRTGTDSLTVTGGPAAAGPMAGNGAAGAEMNSVPQTRREVDEKVDEIIRKLQLTGLEKLRPSQLSGGQQQRCALGRILAGDPELIMLDEPFSALDEYLRDEMIEETMKILDGFGKTAVFVTHSRAEAVLACSDILVFAEGKIQEAGEKKEVFSHPKTEWGRLLCGTAHDAS